VDSTKPTETRVFSCALPGSGPAEESFNFEEEGDTALAALMQRIVACTLASWDSFDRY
jgi:hypothetical protein